MNRTFNGGIREQNEAKAGPHPIPANYAGPGSDDSRSVSSKSNVKTK